MTARTSRSRTARRNYPDDIPPLEWATAGLGLALLIGFLTLILHTAIAGPKGPPGVELRVRAIEEAGDGRYLVLFDAHNRGGTTASALVIEGALHQDGAAVETSQAEIDHLSPGSQRSGGIFFKRDPRTAQLQLSPKSFLEP